MVLKMLTKDGFALANMAIFLLEHCDFTPI
jgi:hypothetical protein